MLLLGVLFMLFVIFLLLVIVGCSMVIHRYKFPFYVVIILISIIIGMIYIYRNLKKEGCNNKQVLLYFIMYFSFTFVFGKMYTSIVFGKTGFMKAGLSSYGGLIGVVVSAIIFEKMLPLNNKLIKHAILSLPLVYGLTKIACAIAGCCGGIPYEGIFKVKYVDMQNIWQFPVQVTETIVSLIIFMICYKFRDKKNISYITLILVSITKFLLDFLRYDHVKILITRNQIFSIILLIITISVFSINKFREKK